MAETQEPTQGYGEGSTKAPERHALDWRSEEFYDREALDKELERIFDICHGCRRCFSLCHAFPTLFDLIDESETMEVDGVARSDYGKVVEHCYLCDMCFMTKCPYVPPHPWNVDFPKLMLRAKAVNFRENGAPARDRLLASTDRVGALASIPIVVNVVNASNRNGAMRGMLESAIGVDRRARLPSYHSNTARKRVPAQAAEDEAQPAGRTRGRVAIFTTCYGNYNKPDAVEDMAAVFRHNGIPVTRPRTERCCGMPRLEMGDLESVARAKEVNIPELVRLIDEGFDIVAPIPSCVLTFKQELPLMFPDDPDVRKVKESIFDPFEYLMIRHRHGMLRTDFKKSLGKVSYHVACHQRVQNIGLRTRDVLALVPDTEVEVIERCSGHDGTYAVKKKYHETSMKIGRPVVNRVKKAEPSYYTSDCPMAAEHIANGLDDGSSPTYPMSLLRTAYGI